MIPKENGRRRAAIGFAAAFAFLWAAIERIGAGIRVSPYEVVWTRYGTQLLLLLLVIAPRYRGRLVRTPRLRLQVASSLLMLGMPVCFIVALQRTTVPNVMQIFWVAPLMVAAASGLLLRERVSLGSWAAVLMASIGAILLTAPHLSSSRLAVVLPLGMAACFAGYQLILRQMSDEPMAPKLFHTALWVFLLLTIVMPHIWRMPSAADLSAMILIGVLGCLALFLLDRAIEFAPPVTIAPALCLQPIWANLLEVKHWRVTDAAGAILIALAIMVVAAVRQSADYSNTTVARGASL